MTTKNTPQRLQSLLLVLHYNKNHSYVLFVHIFLDSLKSPPKFQPFQSQLSRNFASPIIHIFGKCRGLPPPCDPPLFLLDYGQGAAAHLRPPLLLNCPGGCRPPATPRYFLIGQGVILVSFRKGHI